MPPVPDDPPAAEPAAAVSGADTEEVLEAGRPKTSRTRRLREELLLAALVLALIFAVARAMAAGDNKSKAGPSTGPSSTSSSRGAPDTGSGLLNGSVVHVSGEASVPRDGPGACPPRYQCVVAAEPGPKAVAALLAAFPDALLMTTTTVRLLSPNFGQPLWYREITARFGPNRILVRVQRQKPDDVTRQGVAVSEFGVITYYEAPLSTYHVVVQVTTPKGHQQTPGPVKKLAQDVRLLGLS